MSTRRIAVLMATLVFAPPAVAHEEGIYESLHHIPIGRIFLSRGERERLDRYRDAGPPTAVIDTSPRPRKPAKTDKAAGFIVSKSGVRRAWKDGDFVRTSSNRDMRFPGHVEVERVPTKPAEDDTAQDNGPGHEEE